MLVVLSGVSIPSRAPADFARLAEILAGIKGRFLLSFNDRPEVREAFAGLEIEAVETTWSVGARHKRAGEVLISARARSVRAAIGEPA